jgi:energy-coupling factor transporter ATP-binding protein EcfA2
MHNLAIWNAIKLGRNDRGVLIGKTGCGKTTLAKFLIEDETKPYSVTWNPKGSDNVFKWNQTHVTTLRDLQDCEDNRIVYTPSPIVAEDENDQYDFFYWIYERKYTRLYIDEATAIVYSANKPPRYLTAVLNRGRERGISSLTATQRPSGVPMNILSESEHYYVFKTLLPQDKQRIQFITGISVEDQESLDDYQFYYFNVSRGLFPTKLKLNLGEISNARRNDTISRRLQTA